MAMKRTLLEMTQDILVSMDGDEVTSITDSAESASVANIIRQAFYRIVSEAKLPEHNQMFELTATTSSTPVIMYKPSDVIDIHWIKYDCAESGDTTSAYRSIQWMNRDLFLDRMNSLVEDGDIIDSFNHTINSESFVFKYRTDKAPEYYTSWDDNTIVFDSLDTEVDTYLLKIKTQAYGLKESAWTHSNSFVPALDHKLFNLLFQEAKAQAFLELKQIENIKAERAARKGWIGLQRDKYNVNSRREGYYYDTTYLPNYGRK